eukprot:COSAG01_NODE_5219_length_4404_cov_19.378397_8_plen_58_part_00
MLLLPDNLKNFGKPLETLHELAQIRSCPVLVATEQRCWDGSWTEVVAPQERLHVVPS